MAAAHPGSIKKREYGSTHPSSPERFIALEQAVAEINRKKAMNLPLRPEKKKPKNNPSQRIESESQP